MEKNWDAISTGIDREIRRSGAADTPEPVPSNDFKHTEINGRFNKYTSGYWALALPALSVRYAFEAISNMGSRLAKSHNAFRFTEKIEKGYAVGVGAFMMGVTTLYAYRTYN